MFRRCCMKISDFISGAELLEPVHIFIFIFILSSANKNDVPTMLHENFRLHKWCRIARARAPEFNLPTHKIKGCIRLGLGFRLEFKRNMTK